MGDESKVPFLDTLYFENCPGCRIEKKKKNESFGLPYREFFYVWISTLAICLPISSLFPFLYFMIRDLHIANRVEDIGFYAGFVGAALMFGRALTSVFWGIVADRWGRKPVIIIGLFSVIIFNTLFGLSVNYWMAIATRFFLGAFNGILGPIKAYAVEVCRPEHQSIALSLAFSENFTGLELEDGGGRGTSGSHWEKRLLMNEIMTGSVDTRSVVSKMTLALLEDSGWYRANYSMAEHLDWGRNQGTEFVTSPCSLWKGAYRCNTTQLSGCTYNREAEGYCPIVSYSGDLPQWARYFPQANKGGQSSLADYCTYFVAYSDGSCTDTNSVRTPDRMLGEVRGSNSRCMASSLVRAGFVRGSMTQGNGCYQHRCLNNTLEVAVDGIWKTCPEAGGPVQFPGFNGELICPAYHELCSVAPVPGNGQCPNSCTFNGDCVEGSCRCFLGFKGHDCSKRSCPNNCSGRGKCQPNGICACENGRTGVDCSTAICDEQCSLHGGVCDNGVCEFRCSDYAGYTCQNSSMLMSSLSICGDVLAKESLGQHCAPSEPSILQQLEAAVVMPNYNRLMPGGRSLFSIIDSGYCAAAAKRLACWISIQRCDKDGDNRLRVCHSACRSYNDACAAALDCSDQTLFSSEDEKGEQCTGNGEIRPWWARRFRAIYSE